MKFRTRPGVFRIAQHTDGRFDRLPILADALEAAGYTEAELLGQPRGGRALMCGGAGQWIG
jgi:hypothetical protein